MALYKRSGFYWIDVTVRGCRRLRESTRTADSKLVKEYHDKRVAELWRTHRLKDKPRYRWEVAATRWIKETGDKVSHTDDLRILRWLCLDEITHAVCAGIPRTRNAEGVANATCNRTMAVLRAILRQTERAVGVARAGAGRALAARTQGTGAMAQWRGVRPIVPRVTSTPAGHGSLRRAYGPAGSEYVRVALVDLRRGMAALVKNRQSLGVPLDSTALAVVREQIGKYSERVFMYKEWPVRKMNKDGWCKALRPAGIKDFRVHDLQHQLTSMHAQAGMPLNVLQALGGRKAPTMV
ncbi:MAG: tyrosine-type recombinase/integrase [Gammaproteobacteria bacterium]|nr:tyrosine-type recombinase/integrase [Gammaproteobacteria bacterium]